jgi:hypothetical protein
MATGLMPTDATKDKKLSVAVLGSAAIAVCWLLVTRLDYVPIWDGGIYAACISAASEKFTLGALRCGGHASQAYAAVAALAQMLAPASAVPLLVTNAALFALACVGFHRLTRLLFPSVPSVDRALLTAAFIVHPAFVSAVVQPGLDLPLLPAFLWALVFALERRWVALVLTGVALAFTKETGILLYAVLLVCYGWWFELRPNRPVVDRVGRLVRLTPLALPGIVFLAYLAYRRLANPAQPVIWYTGTTGNSLIEQFLVPRLDLYQVNYAALLLVLNFGWVLTAAIGADALVGMVRAGHREPARPLPGIDRERLGFLVLVTVTTGYALTRFTTFGHTRYFLIIYALLLVPFFAALVRLGLSTTARRIILGAYAVALLASVARTIDPVSRRLYGTFAFGTHRMLRMTRVTGECCAFGQDQLAYSLEFTTLQPLTDAAVSAVVASPSTVIVVPDGTSWIFLDAPDAGRRRFAYRAGAGGEPNVVEHREVVAGRNRPASAVYLALPNGDNARAMRELAPLYEFRDERRFDRNGYSLSTYRLLPRQATQP